MKPINKMILATAAFAVAALPGTSQGALIAYEGFDYTSGSSINSANGGSGWGGSWSVSTFGSGSGSTVESVQSSGLSYTGVTSSGNSIGLDVDRPSGSNFRGIDVDRTLSSSVSSGTIWASWLYNSSEHSVSGSTSSWSVFALTFTGGTNYNRLEFGRDALSPWDSFQVGFQGGPDPDDINLTSQTVTTGTTYLVTARIDFNTSGSNDSLYVWVNPSTSSEPTIASALFSSTTLDFGALQGVRILSGFADGGGLVNNVTLVDEIRIGTDYLSTVPEPSSLALLIGGAVALFAIRLRRRG
ncbi:MAG: hypothetical protein OHK005_19300 [Candidatus Methylacidiphilales bacterium]